MDRLRRVLFWVGFKNHFHFVLLDVLLVFDLDDRNLVEHLVCNNIVGFSCRIIHVQGRSERTINVLDGENGPDSLLNELLRIRCWQSLPGCFLFFVHFDDLYVLFDLRKTLIL